MWRSTWLLKEWLEKVIIVKDLANVLRLNLISQKNDVVMKCLRYGIMPCVWHFFPLLYFIFWISIKWVISNVGEFLTCKLRLNPRVGGKRWLWCEPKWHLFVGTNTIIKPYNYFFARSKIETQTSKNMCLGSLGRQIELFWKVGK